MASNGEPRAELEALRQDMSKLRTDLSSVIRSLMDEGKTRAGAMATRAKETGKRAVEATEEQIKERPFLSILVVFLVGLILGKLFDQKMRA